MLQIGATAKAMTKSQFEALFYQGADQVVDITRKVVAPGTALSRLLYESRSMRANEDAQIYDHLHEAFNNIVANIDETIWDNQAHRKVIPMGPFALEVSVIHREPNLEKITGVDVLYNAGDIKVLLFQHKKRDRQGRFSLNREDLLQMEQIKQECTECSKAKIMARGRFVRHHCASMYVVGDVSSDKRHVVSACEVAKYRKQLSRHSNESTSYHPISISEVDSLFTTCLVGRVLDARHVRQLADEFREISLGAHHVLIDATLR